MAADIFSTVGQRVKARMGLLSPEELQAMQSQPDTGYAPDPYPVWIPQSDGSNFGNPYDADIREQDAMRRGQAPLTMDNLGKLASNVMSVMGPSGLMQAAAGSIVENAIGQPGTGTYGGFQNFKGWSNHLDDDLKAMVGVGSGKLSASQAFQKQRERDAAKAKSAMEAQDAQSAMGRRGIGQSGGGLGGNGRGGFGAHGGMTGSGERAGQQDKGGKRTV